MLRCHLTAANAIGHAHAVIGVASQMQAGKRSTDSFDLLHPR